AQTRRRNPRAQREGGQAFFTQPKKDLRTRLLAQLGTQKDVRLSQRNTRVTGSLRTSPLAARFRHHTPNAVLGQYFLPSARPGAWHDFNCSFLRIFFYERISSMPTGPIDQPEGRRPSAHQAAKPRGKSRPCRLDTVRARHVKSFA